MAISNKFINFKFIDLFSTGWTTHVLRRLFPSSPDSVSDTMYRVAVPVFLVERAGEKNLEDAQPVKV